jgi:hypothetical protein
MLRLSDIAVLVLPLILGACRHIPPVAASPELSPRQKLIGNVQEFGRSSGFEATGSFSHHSADRQAFYRCYYTEKLRLPDSYDGLKLEDGTAQGCDIDERKYDVFFYPVEAIASPKVPVTGALTEASLERVAVVVSHEEFHQQKAIRRLPVTVGEAAATLIGFQTAAGYALAAYGRASSSYRNLSGEAERFLKKAEIINRFHASLATVYRQAADGKIARAAALSEKRRLFEQLQHACEAITPAPSSFHPCPAAMNNAGLAFDHTYAKHYALLYQLALNRGQNLPSLVGILQNIPETRRFSEQEAVAFLSKLIARPARPPAGIGKP